MLKESNESRNFKKKRKENKRSWMKKEEGQSKSF